MEGAQRPSRAKLKALGKGTPGHLEQEKQQQAAKSKLK
jgi:hypothetical protein